MERNFVRSVAFALLLMAIPATAILITDTTSVLASSRPARMTKRLVAEVASAKKETNRVARVARLKRIDPTRTPRAVQLAFSDYVVALERSAAGEESGRAAAVRQAEERFEREVTRTLARGKRR